MTHWSLDDLADYIRGVAPPERDAAIEADAASPAATAPGGANATGLGTDLELLRELSTVLRGDHEAQPSDDTMLAVSAIFAAAARSPNPQLLPLPLLTVRDPAAGLFSGFRSAQLGHKDLEIHGERFDLDLSIDTPFDAIDVVIVGRLAPGESETWSVERVPAILVAGGTVLATAVTNQFGEFHVATESEADDVELCLLIQGVGQIRVPIDRREPVLPGRR